MVNSHLLENGHVSSAIFLVENSCCIACNVNRPPNTKNHLAPNYWSLLKGCLSFSLYK